MFTKRIRTAGLALAAALGLAACTDGYGYSGVSLGYGSAGYYDPYYDQGYYGGSSYYGWNNGYYYPGTGYYVYDQYRRPVRWNSAQRRYWQARRNAWRGEYSGRPNWGGWEMRRDERGDRRITRRPPPNRGEWRGDRDRDRPGRGEWRGNRGDADRGEWRGNRGDGNRGGRGEWRGNRGGGEQRARPPRPEPSARPSRPEPSARPSRGGAGDQHLRRARESRGSGDMRRPREN